MYLEWAKSARGWFPLDDVPLRDLHASGVYVIWRSGSPLLRPSTVVRVGHGDIAVQLAANRMDTGLRAGGHELLVTWAAVEDAVAAGVSTYLTRLLRPSVVDVPASEVDPVPVNLPLPA